MDSVSRQLRKITVNDSKFMANFDPYKSKREQMKKNKKGDNYKSYYKMRKTYENRKSVKDIYDNKGVHVMSGEDYCDCLEPDCMGCFFPCQKCKSEKCGLECRNKRKHYYKQIEDQIVEVRRTNSVAIAYDEELQPIHLK